MLQMVLDRLFLMSLLVPKSNKKLGYFYAQNQIGQWDYSILKTRDEIIPYRCLETKHMHTNHYWINAYRLLRNHIGPVRLTQKPTCSACFFSRNIVFLSQQFSQKQCFQPVSAKIQQSERGHIGETKHMDVLSTAHLLHEIFILMQKQEKYNNVESRPTS